MYSYTLSQWILFFVLYCFVGWCIETTFMSFCERHFVNRGFLTGPVIPIYGFGAIAILFVALPVRGNWIAVFFLGMLAATALEYVTGVVMEAIFKVRYWDYSNNKLNLNGHICLSSSLFWGVLSVVLTRLLHRPVETLVLSLPEQVGEVSALILAVVMAADTVLSLKNALDLRQLLVQRESYSRKAKEDVKVLQRRLEIISTFTRDTLETQITEYIKGRPDGGESIVRRIEALEQAAQRLEQSEAAQKLRTDLAVWKARLAARSEQARLNRGQRIILRNNPRAKSRRYDEQLRQLQSDDRKKEQ